MNFENIQFILTDIEGTTSDLLFVKNVLFPYSAREMRNFVSQNRTRPDVKECLAQTEGANDNEAIDKLLSWIDQDLKHPALKSLQGMIWKAGYEKGHFKAHFYPDTIEAFKLWKAKGLKIGVYSSGSVMAQKLFFRHSEFGDLTPFIEAYFDLSIGPKKEALSYIKITQSLGLQPPHVLFLSDIEAELNAAQNAGLQTCQLLRPHHVASDRHKKVRDFLSIQLQ